MTIQDSGLYLCQAYFKGVSRDPEYAEINLSVQGKTFCKSLCKLKSISSDAGFPLLFFDNNSNNYDKIEIIMIMMMILITK